MTRWPGTQGWETQKLLLGIRSLGEDCRPRTTLSHLRTSYPCTQPDLTPTRRYHSGALIRPSLRTGAFSPLPCTINMG